MFSIRQIHDLTLPVNREALRQVKEIIASQIVDLSVAEISELEEKFFNPFKKKLRPILYVAQQNSRRVAGFALLLHEPAIGFCYLEYLASLQGLRARGIGAALYEQVREEAQALKASALFFECLPDEPVQCPNPELLKQNRSRLRFYEHYGARPIMNPGYQAPINPGDQCMPFLMCDGLDRSEPIRREFVRQAARAILERKYGDICTPKYVKSVVDSFADDPAILRPFAYLDGPAPPAPAPRLRHGPCAMVVNEGHSIHHIRERGYVEAPVRVPRILEKLAPAALFETVKAREHSMTPILAVHDACFVEYLRRACAVVPEGQSVYPYVFPIRNGARPPVELTMRAGYYCIDTFTPINRHAFPAAKGAADCALTAARLLLEGRRLAYALVRPPGHHAERRAFGGFCYFNNAAIAANELAKLAPVAMLDIDYHHGNGQQNIFYERADVLTISIHGHPRFAYPYFSGFEDERGKGAGEGFNGNMPLPETLDAAQYRKALTRAIKKVADFRPGFLVVPLGLDTAKGDPTGTWALSPQDFHANGRLIGELKLPTLVVQEGGYRTRTLGLNALKFFEGLMQGAGLQ